MRQISVRGIGGIRNSVGVGYIVVPKDIDRDLYVENCFRNGCVAIQTDFGEFIDKVKIDKTAIKDVDFPIDYEHLGSFVVWVSIPKHKLPVVVGVLMKNDELWDVTENQFQLRKEFNGTIVEINGDADQGVVSINVAGGDRNGVLNISVNNKDKTGKINLIVDSELNIQSGNKISVSACQELTCMIKDFMDSSGKETIISYKNGTGFSYKDEFDNEITLADKQLTVKSPKTNLGDGSYSVKDLFYDIITEVAKSTVQTQMGIQPLLNKAQIELLKDNVDKIFN